MVFLKGLSGGLVAVCVTWVVIVFINNWRENMLAKQQGITGLRAVAGGWNYLLQLPLVVILLTVAFGMGLYLTVHRR
jgi:TRAP-type C4-dicarboxylate transport system permease large subunit